jgi:uncharacterized membrane protein YtjA (UPF0391 family)
MLRWALIFFIVALLSAVFGFTEIAAGAAWAAKALFFLFLVCFVVFFVSGLFGVRRRRLLLVRVRTSPARK